MTDAPAGARAAVAGLQHERTTLAWERTAFTFMGTGVVLGRFAGVHELLVAEAGAMALVILGAALLVWAGAFYERRGVSIEQQHDIAHPRATRAVGAIAIAASATCLAAGIAVVVEQLT